MNIVDMIEMQSKVAINSSFRSP